MKQLMLVCWLAASAVAVAQTPPRAEVERDHAEVAKREAEEARTRAKLEEARARLDKAAREVAELSSQLGRNAREMIWVNNDRRAVLGVQIENAGDKSGVRVLRVSPGGPAAEAGLRDGDVIISLDGKSVAGSASPGRLVNEQMRSVKPEQKVKVRVIRAGKNKDFVVVARPMAFDEHRVFNVHGGPEMVAGTFSNVSPWGHHFAGFSPGEFGGMELASITPKLGAYFGVTEGVLVVQAPDSEAFKLEDGDVLQTIDGRKPEDGAHALRILRSYKSGEKLNISVLRQRKPVTLAVTMPERPDLGENNLFQVPPPPLPPMPPMPPVPAVPDGAGFGGGTLE